MAKKKKKSTRARKKESSINTNLIIGIALIAVLIYGGTHDWFKGITSMSVTGDTTTQLNYADIDGTGGCEISTDKDAYYCGQWVKATLQDGKNTKCYIFINKDNSEWEYWGDITTDDNGEAIKQGPVNEAGNYKIRVLCENQCISNLLDINVICDGSDDDEEQDQEQQQIICEDVELPQYGDLDTLCQEATSCENEECHHYWWWNGKEHKCEIGRASCRERVCHRV